MELVMRLLSSLFALGVLCLGPIACGGSSDAGDSEGLAAGEDEELKKAIVIGMESNGKTVDVTLGRPFTIALQDQSASTGYRWMTESYDKTIGAPKTSYVAPPTDEIGAKGTSKFSWKTSSPLDLLGKHTITLILQRPWAETSPPAATFKVTVNIVK